MTAQDRVNGTIRPEGTVETPREIVRTSGKSARLSAELVLELRRRVRDGCYDTPAMAAEVARRMLRSGDL